MADITSMTSQGPARERPPRQELEDKAKVNLWRAVWEASQFVSTTTIREYVDSTCREIESDEP